MTQIRFLINVFLSLRFYRGVGWLLFKLSKIEGDEEPHQLRILYLSKPIFNDDVEALKVYSKESLYIRFPRILLQTVINKFLPYAEELNDANYHIKTKNDPSLKELRKFWDVILPYLQHKLNFDALLSGNFVYVSEQELFRIAQKHNIPTLVLYKEGMFPTDRSEDVKGIFYTTKKFSNDKILFYNEGIRKILINSQLPGLTREKTAVVGVPRFDYSFNSEKISSVISDNKQIILFSFNPAEKSEYLTENQSKKDGFEKRLYEFQTDLIAFCASNPDYTLVIKTKTTPSAVQFAQNMIDSFGFTSMPKNIRLTNKDSPKKLIEESLFIAGYSSTTLIEGLIHNKVIMSPDVFYYFQEKSADLFGNKNLGVHYLSKYRDMEKLIFTMSSAGFKMDEMQNYTDKTEFVQSMIYRMDGKASERVEMEIKSIINEKRNRQTFKVNKKY